MRSPAPGEVMDITNMLNNKGAIAAHHQLQGQFVNAQHAQHHIPLVKSEPDMERSTSPHGSEHSHYSVHMSRAYGSPAPIATQMHMSNPMSNAMHNNMQLPSFPEVPSMQNMSTMSMQHIQQTHPTHHHHHHQQIQSQPQPTQPPAKTYPCSTCGKHFARRSDLARHERIHSGIRPHVCDFEGCGKQFIQRSALTVHHRVHTGEKPHQCEICAKPFSDSSSLARHRRTHTGKRPYKCPYANCQKTFTRRTTLTRHQMHHTGTIEEARAATEAALAASRPRGTTQPPSNGDHISVHGSPMTTPSPSQRTMSMSPTVDMTSAGNMTRSDLSYMQQNGNLPVHLRVGSPSSTTSGGFNNGIRPTSHPTGYGPPQTLEPSVDHNAGPGSGANSPHMANVGWQSPSHVPSPANSGNGYVYPDPDTYPPSQAMNQMYYNATQQMRRPTSAELGMVHMA